MASGNLGTIYLGDDIADASERALLEHVFTSLDGAGAPFVILANCHYGRQLDCIVATADRVTAIEAKSSRLPVMGGMQGRWQRLQPDGTYAPYRNAYLQAVHGKNALRDAMARKGDLGDWYPDGLVVFTSGLPAGSDITTGDYKARVVEINAMDLAGAGPGSPWSLDQWHRFARESQLTATAIEDALAPRALRQPLQIVRDYRDAVAREYGRGPRWLAESEDVRDAVRAALREPVGCFVSGPSGCGKTLLAREFAAEASRDGITILFLTAKQFGGSWRALVRRELALISTAAPAAFYRAVRDMQPPTAIILDGLNELPDAEETLRGLRALAARLGARLIVTSQSQPPAQLSALTRLEIERPTIALKQRIAEADARKLGSPALEALKAARSGFEARVIGQIADALTADLPHQQLMDLYVRTLLGDQARAGSLGLRRLAIDLQGQLAFSIAETAFDELMVANNIPDDACRAIFSAGLLVRRGGRISFGHEIIQRSCAAFALADLARQNPSAYGAILRTVPFEPVAGNVLALLEDRAACEAILEQSTDGKLLRDCADSLHGPVARSVAQALLDAASADCLAEINGLDLKIVPGDRARVDWDPDSLRDWSSEQQARLVALALDIWTETGIAHHLALCAAMDERSYGERQRIFDEATAAGCRTLRSDTFWLAYYGYGQQTGFSHVARSLQFVFEAPPESLPDFHFDVVRLTSGQLHFYLENRYSLRAAKDKERFAEQLIFCLRERFASEPYHVRLAILNAAGFARTEAQTINDRLIEAVRALDVPLANLALNSSIIDALKFLGALDDPDETARAGIRRELAMALGADASDFACNWALATAVAMFDHPYDAIYYEEIEALDDEDRRRLYRRALAAPEAKQSMSLAWLVRQVAAFDDPQDGAIMQHLAGLPSPANPMAQEEWSAFVDAIRFLGRHDLPLLPVDAASDAERCLAIARELVYLAKARAGGRVVDTSTLWHALGAMPLENVIGTLGEAQQALTEAHWSERFQPFEHLDLATAYPDQCLALARAFLDRDLEAAYFHAVPAREWGPNFVFHVILTRGDRSDLERLKPFTIGHRHARRALETLRALDLVPPS